MKLGNKLENPYSVKNMRKALADLQGDNALKSGSLSDADIPTTHLYVRFLPTDTAQLNVLLADKSLELFDYPLDYNILEEGTYYHDPSIPQGQMTWLYTTVSPDFKFPNLRYEIIEECFIPDDSTNVTVAKSLGLVGDELEEKALRNAGYFEREQQYVAEPSLKRLFGGDYPDGYIQVANTVSGQNAAVKGVKVRCHIAVKWSTDYTDETGYYRMPSKFPVGPHYALVFDNSKGFTIWNNWAFLAAANYGMGWHSKGGYSQTIDKNSVAWDLCTVNNAGFEYYQWCSNNAIHLPPSDLKIWISGAFGNSAPMMRRVYVPLGINGNSWWTNFLVNSTVGVAGNTVNMGLQAIQAQPDITIKGGYDDSYVLTTKVCHELSHASHFTQVGKDYWAKYIDYIVTYGAYGGPGDNNSGICGVGEMWGYFNGSNLANDLYPQKGREWAGEDNWFSPLILQRLYRNCGVTPKQIFDCLTGDVKSHEELKIKLKSKYGKDSDITNAFAIYSF